MPPAGRAPRGSVAAFRLMLEVGREWDLFTVDGHATILDMSIEAAIRKIIREELARARPDAPAARREVVGIEVERQCSVKSVALILDVSADYVEDRIKDGSLPRRLDLGSTRAKYRIPASDLQAFIDARTSSASE